MKRNLIKIISLCLCIFVSIGALSSCELIFGSQDSPDGSQQGNNSETTNPPSTSGGGNGDGEEEVTYSDKGIFFSSLAEDEGDGTLEKPYNSLEVISTLTIEPGAYIYIQKGSVFKGGLVLSGISGSDDEPVVVTSYGEGDKPKIDGNGLIGSGVVHIANCSNIVVEELEITDSATEEADRRGVLITCDNNKGTEELITYKNITLKNLYIHNIQGERDAENSGMAMSSKITGGIHLWSNDGLGRVDGLEITGCQITEVSNVGIATWYQVVKNDDESISVNKVNPYSAKFKDYAHLNVNIHDNQINYIGKNAIFVRHLYGGIIEKNVVHDTAIYCVSGNTIVTSYVDGTVIQYNEGYRNMAKVRESDGALQDGCMLDADLASKDTVWQYNYSHDNSFGLFICCTYNNSSCQDIATVRYNLSVNDKGNKGIIYINMESAGIYVYNNTIVTDYDTQYIIQVNDGTTSYFYNNLIYNRSSTAKMSISDECDVSGEYNLVYSESGSSISGLSGFKNININGVYEDPEFVEILSEDSIFGINRLDDYKVFSSSPAIGVGRETEAVSDFFGNRYKKSIGFYCGD